MPGADVWLGAVEAGPGVVVCAVGGGWGVESDAAVLAEAHPAAAMAIETAMMRMEGFMIGGRVSTIRTHAGLKSGEKVRLLALRSLRRDGTLRCRMIGRYLFADCHGSRVWWRFPAERPWNPSDRRQIVEGMSGCGPVGGRVVRCIL
jgi:hypothetical protein